jgi:general secretion pathway protein G
VSEKIRGVLRGEKGFTLVEMMVVLVIIAVLIALGIRAYIGYIGNSRMTKARDDITTVQAALDAYYVKNQSYPNGTDDEEQSALATAGISSYQVNSVSGTNNAPYVYFSSASNTYKVYTVTSVNDNYMEGIGINGVSQLATLVASQ